MAKVGVQTRESEGDVRPFLAFGETLAAAGHDVRIVVTDRAGRRYSMPPETTLAHVGADAALPPEQVDGVVQSAMRAASPPEAGAYRRGAPVHPRGGNDAASSARSLHRS